MIQIRRGVFETNSSSSHSIVITKEDMPIKGMVDDGWIDTKGGLNMMSYDLEFGRAPFDILSDWKGRLRYAIASSGGDPDKIAELEQICFSRVAGFTHFDFSPSAWDDGYYYGYIDHQSIGLLDRLLETVSLEDFIFNDRYIVIIDGDEYLVFDTLMKSPMFNMDAIEEIID